MTKTRPTGIFNHRSYTIEELSVLLSKNKKTLLRWIGDGLKTVPESKKPILIMGFDLKEFLGKKNAKKKVKLNLSEFFCLSCRKGVYAKEGSIENLGNRKIAVCGICGVKIGRIIKPYQKGL